MKMVINVCLLIAAMTAFGLVLPAELSANDQAYQEGYDQGMVEGYNRGYRDASAGRRHHYHPPDGYGEYERGLHDGRHAGYSTGYDDARQGRPHRFERDR